VPVSGTVRILSEGSRIAELLSNVTGHVDLQADRPRPGAAPQARRRLTMKAARLPDGLRADISSLQWGESELAGRVSYRRTSPPSLDIELQGGELSLLPWENPPERQCRCRSLRNPVGLSGGPAPTLWNPPSR
jgi:hypothetical protein